MALRSDALQMWRTFREIGDGYPYLCFLAAKPVGSRSDSEREVAIPASHFQSIEELKVEFDGDHWQGFFVSGQRRDSDPDANTRRLGQLKAGLRDFERLVSEATRVAAVPICEGGALPSWMAALLTLPEQFVERSSDAKLEVRRLTQDVFNLSAVLLELRCQAPEGRPSRPLNLPITDGLSFIPRSDSVYSGYWIELHLLKSVRFAAEQYDLGIFDEPQLGQSFATAGEIPEWPERKQQFMKALAAILDECRRMEPPSIDTPEKLSAECLKVIDLLVPVASWFEQLQNEPSGSKTPRDRFLDLDRYSPNDLIREVWNLMCRLPGGGQPPLPKLPILVNGALSQMHLAVEWCKDQNSGKAPSQQNTSNETPSPKVDSLIDGSPSSAEIEADKGESSSPASEVAVKELKHFNGGEMVFFADRVELCGVVICRGLRQGSMRIVLELFSLRRKDGPFISYFGDELEAKAKRFGAKGSASGWIRDLRTYIVESLRDRAGTMCGRRDVILSGKSGYRLADSISVQFVAPPTITDITDISDTDDGTNVRDDDVRDVRNVRDPEDSAVAKRRSWILEQLQNGVKLKAPMVAERFKRSIKTAQRDLDALREEGQIVFVGDPRTGYYKLAESKKGTKSS